MQTTIDYGIDLGTTNSAIARQRGAQPELYRGPDGKTWLPSAVAVDGQGLLHVGSLALAQVDAHPASVAIEFKRLMGTAEQRAFPGGKTLSPEELSAAVLRELLRWAAHADQAQPIAAVITVPAMFQLPQCEATRRAARLAGLEHAPLLQEPIAAAIAHSGSGELGEGYWMVYDLGGGTFDVSLVRSKAGRLQVLDHDGDNHLGGRDFDRLLARQALARAREANLVPERKREDPAYTALFARLKAEAERVRISLSVAEVESLAQALEGGGQLAFPVSRGELEALILPTVKRTTALCQKVLDRGRVKAADLKGLVMVGGPSLTPLVARRLEEDLELEARHVGDPMTIVARGAALFASTQKLPAELRARSAGTRAAGTLVVDLQVEAMTTDPEPLLVGRANLAELEPGTSIAIRRADGGFETPAIAIGRDGAFAVDLALAPGRLNVFELRARGGAGQALPVEPAQFSVLHGLSVARPPLSQSVGVMLADNKVCWYLKKGAVLPARNVQVHATTVPLLAGQSGEAVHVPLVQGESGRADRNKVIGVLSIKADEIARDLPVGSEVEVTINVDESAQTVGQAYVPLLGQTFDDIVLFRLEAKPAAQVSKTLDEQKARLAALEQLADDMAADPAAPAADARVGEVEALISEGDRDSLDLADQLVRVMSQELDEAEEVGRKRSMHKDYEARLAEARDLVGKYGEPAEQRQLDALVGEYTAAMAKNDLDLAQSKSDDLDNLHTRVLLRQPGYWIGLFQHLKGRLTAAGKTSLCTDKLARAEQAIHAKQWQTLSEVCMALIRVLNDGQDVDETDLPGVRSHVK
jgi:molecular chaperone DnaK